MTWIKTFRMDEDERVKQETVRSAEKLLSDTQAQVDEGTLAQVELARAIGFAEQGVKQYLERH